MGNKCTGVGNAYCEDIWLRLDKDKEDVRVSDLTVDGQKAPTGSRVTLDWDKVYSHKYTLLERNRAKEYEFEVSARKKKAYISIVTSSGLVICNQVAVKNERGVLVNQNGYIQDLDDESVNLFEALSQEPPPTEYTEPAHAGSSGARKGKRRKAGKGRRRRNSEQSSSSSSEEEEEEEGEEEGGDEEEEGEGDEGAEEENEENEEEEDGGNEEQEEEPEEEPEEEEEEEEEEEPEEDD